MSRTNVAISIDRFIKVKDNFLTKWNPEANQFVNGSIVTRLEL